jgi:hypothetical protein
MRLTPFRRLNEAIESWLERILGLHYLEILYERLAETTGSTEFLEKSWKPLVFVMTLAQRSFHTSHPTTCSTKRTASRGWWTNSERWPWRGGTRP